MSPSDKFFITILYSTSSVFRFLPSKRDGRFHGLLTRGYSSKTIVMFAFLYILTHSPTHCFSSLYIFHTILIFSVKFMIAFPHMPALLPPFFLPDSLASQNYPPFILLLILKSLILIIFKHSVRFSVLQFHL